MRSLVDAAASEFGRMGASATQCVLPERHEYAEALRRAGFVPVPRKSAGLRRKFAIAPRLMPPAELAFLASPDVRLHITEGDSDLI